MRIPICGIGITTHAQQPNIARKKLGNGSCDVFMPRQACHDDGEVRDYQSQQQAKKDAEDKLHDVSLIHLELRCGEKSAKQHPPLGTTPHWNDPRVCEFGQISTVYCGPPFSSLCLTGANCP